VQSRLQAERTALAQEQSALAGLVRSAYAFGPGDRIRLLLDQRVTTRLSRVMAYYGYLNRYRVERLETIAERARNLESLALEAGNETARLARLAAHQEETRTRLVSAQSQRSGLLDDLEQTISSGEERMTALRAEAEGLRDLLEQLERQATGLAETELIQAPMVGQRGQLRWPLEPARLIASFGQPKGDAGQLWDGVFIAAPAGTEVRAVRHGRVVYSDWLRGFGLLTILEHDSGYMTLYGHNQALLKEPGEWVASGDTIALSGASGGLRDAGLYFAIRHRGTPLDPQRWCRSTVDQDKAEGANNPRLKDGRNARSDT
jgi:septal ring factor EnvC (AmiA/AmiB activator)